MAITVALRPKLEAWLSEEAARDGVTPGEVVAHIFEMRGAMQQLPFASLTDDELMQRPHQDFSPEFWEQYRLLSRKLQEEQITEPERTEFLRLHQQAEALNTERLTLLAQLAARRGQTLPQVMQMLGIGPVRMPAEMAS